MKPSDVIQISVYIFADVLEDTEVSTVMSAGLAEMIEHIHLLPSAFLQVGGQFFAELQGVALVAGMSMVLNISWFMDIPL